MKTTNFYSLEVNKPVELLHELLGIVPVGSKISFEGKLNSHLASKVCYAETEEGLLQRNTRTPRQDFWVLTIDQSNITYLRNEFLDQIGIVNNVLHILIENKGHLIFFSYDQFHYDCVGIAKADFITISFMVKLKKKEIVRDFKEMNAASNNTF